MIILIILYLTAYSKAQNSCGICGPDTGIACISETEFYLCNNDEPDTSQIIECANGYICNSLSNNICDLIGSTVMMIN